MLSERCTGRAVPLTSLSLTRPAFGVNQVPPVGFAAYHIKLSDVAVEISDDCSDKQGLCAKWAEDGECGRNPDFMHLECPRSCAQCPHGQVRGNGADVAMAAHSTHCTTSPAATGSMRCLIEEQFREEITFYNLTASIFNETTNTESLVTVNNVTSSVLDRSTVRSLMSDKLLTADQHSMRGCCHPVLADMAEICVFACRLQSQMISSS